MTLYFGLGQKKSINVGRFSIEILHNVSKHLEMRKQAERSTGYVLNVLNSIYSCLHKNIQNKTLFTSMKISASSLLGFEPILMCRK